jgi:hypothetical protein
MAADPGRAVLEGIEALGVPELHVFLLRLGIDGRGLDPDRLCDIAVEALRLRPRLVESAWLRGQAGAPVPARSGRPWDAEKFFERQDVAQPSWPSGANGPSAAGGSQSSVASYGDAGGLDGTGSSHTDQSAGSRSAGSGSSSGSSAQSYVGGDATPLPHGGSQVRADFEQQLADLARAQHRLAEDNRELRRQLDPEARFDFMAQAIVEPSMRAILSGRLSEQDIRRIRAYRISPDAMEKLVEHDIVPAGYPDPNVLFSDGAYRLDGPADMQLPMSTLQRDLVEQHLAVHEDWPERATHYSRVDWDEFQQYEKKDKDSIERENDKVQASMWELKNLVYMGYTLVDESRDAETRVGDVLRFLAVQTRLLFDDIAHAEAAKQVINDSYVGGGLKMQRRTSAANKQVGPDVTSSDRRAKLAQSVATTAAITSAKSTWAATAAGKGGRNTREPATPQTAAQKAAAAAKADKTAADKSAKRAADQKRAAAAKGGGGAEAKPGKGDKDPGYKGGPKCHACGERGHKVSDCTKKPAGWDDKRAKVPSPAPAPDPDKPKRLDGSTRSASPSHERNAYVPGSAQDPAADRAARDTNVANNRRVQRPAGGQ